MEEKDLIGLDWAKQVLRGEFKANKYVILECARYVKRMNEGNIDDGNGSYYFFDFDEVEFVYDLMSLINYSTGFYAGEPVIDHISGFQAMIVENLFGWIHINKGIRLITDMTLLVGRKSGKSFLCALLEILLMMTGEKFQQHGLGAKTRDISAIVKRETEQLIKSSPGLSKHFKIQRDKIECRINESFMKNYSGEANNINGLLLTSYIVDEVGNMVDHEVIGALRLSQMSTKQRLGVHISTAYNLEINAMRDLCDLHKKNLDGLTDDIHSFGLIFELDEGDDYTNEENWIKASPLQMTIEDGIEFMRSEFKKALEVPEKMKEFRIKLLNQWISNMESEEYINLEDFRRCKITSYDWYGRDVYLGLDLSMTNDNTSLAMVTYDEARNKIVIKSFAFLPSDNVDIKSKKEKVDYRSMIEQNLCYACGDRVIDYSFIEDFILNLENKYGVNVVALGYDRYNCISTANKLSNKGMTTVEIMQHSKVLHPSTKLLKERVLNKELEYEMNKLLEINIANCRETKDTNLNGYVNKKKSNGKVDMVVAIINALKLLNDEVFIEDGEVNVFIV